MTSAIPKPMLMLRDILIIEDDQDHLELITQALEEGGIKNPIHSACTIQDGLSHLRECAEHASAGGDHLPCLVLLDLRLPDGSGLDLLREIKRDRVLRTVPVVVLTTSDDPPDIQDAYMLGVNSYLVKPIRFEDFHRKVREAGLYWALLNQSYQPTAVPSR